MSHSDPIRQDFQATLDARRDLGPDYEGALVASFTERLDATIAARVQAELDSHGPARRPKKSGGGAAMIPIALGSLALGIPLTAIAQNAGLFGLVLTWAAIVTINIAAAVAIGLRRD